MSHGDRHAAWAQSHGHSYRFAGPMCTAFRSQTTSPAREGCTERCVWFLSTAPGGIRGMKGTVVLAMLYDLPVSTYME